LLLLDKFHPPGRLKLRSHLFSASRTGFASKLKPGKLFIIEVFPTMNRKQVFIPQFHDLSTFYKQLVQMLLLLNPFLTSRYSSNF
jgi:hypothetical protein